MTQDERIAIERAYTEYWDAKEALAALEASCAEITTTSSITTEDGYLMFTPSGLRLLDVDYVKEVVAQYHAARERKGFLRKRLIKLGEPDPG